LANAALPQPSPSKARVMIVDASLGDRVFEAPLAGDGLGRCIGHAAKWRGRRRLHRIRSATGRHCVRAGFRRSAAITLDSPPGARLLALCRNAAPDPFAIETSLTELDAAAGNTSLSEARTD
jgi:hypothetical protein